MDRGRPRGRCGRLPCNQTTRQIVISDALLSKLGDPSLIRDQALIGGRWIGANAVTKTFEVRNPSNGEGVAILPDLDRAFAKEAIHAAFLAQKDWASKTGKERAAVLRRLHDLVVANSGDLGNILTTEMGKPFLGLKARCYMAPATSSGSARKQREFTSGYLRQIRREALSTGGSHKGRRRLRGWGSSRPLIDQKALRKVEEHLEDAVAHGAHVASGGKSHERDYFSNRRF